MKILIVDDDADFADSLRDLLRVRGHEAEACYACAGGIRELERGSFDLVIVDWSLGTERGDGVCAAATKSAASPFVAVASGYSRSQIGDPLDGVSIDAFVRKPIGREQLEALLHQAQERVDALP